MRVHIIYGPYIRGGPGKKKTTLYLKAAPVGPTHVLNLHLEDGLSLLGGVGPDKYDVTIAIINKDDLNNVNSRI